jgi:uncharacterized protein with gpF-like domain
MTTDQQDEIWHKFNRFVKRYEAMYTKQFNDALKEQMQQYIDTGTVMSITSTPVYEALVSLYKASAVVWAHQSQLQTQRIKARQPMGFSERIVELMRKHFGIDLLNIAQGITDTTKRVIQEVLSKAVELGWSFNEIVRRLQSPDLTRIRARLIARTETVSAANSAAIINAKETAAKTGLKLNKIWIAARDNRTRHDHREVNQTVVAVDDYFVVGGYYMSQPGDRTQGAPAAEICNCRCVVGMIPVGP